MRIDPIDPATDDRAIQEAVEQVVDEAVCVRIEPPPIRLGERHMRLDRFCLGPQSNVVLQHRSVGAKLINQQVANTSVLKGEYGQNVSLARHRQAAQIGMALEQPHPFTVMPRLDDKTLLARCRPPVAVVMFAQHARLAVEKTLGEEAGEPVGVDQISFVSGRLKGGEQALEQVHIGVLLSLGQTPFVHRHRTITGRKMRLNRFEHRFERGAHLRLPGRAIEPRECEQQESMVVSISPGFDHQPVAGQIVDKAGREAFGAGMVHEEVETCQRQDVALLVEPSDLSVREDVDLARLDPHPLRRGKVGRAGPVEPLDEAFTGIDSGRRPERKGASRQPTLDPGGAVRR